VHAAKSAHSVQRVRHKAEALEDTLDVDVFSPTRQDWLDKSVPYCALTMDLASRKRIRAGVGRDNRTRSPRVREG